MKILISITFIFIISYLAMADELKLEGEKSSGPISNEPIEIIPNEGDESPIFNEKIKSTDIPAERVRLYLKVRRDLPNKKVAVYRRPKAKGNPVYFLEPGDILTINITKAAFQKLVANERQDKGSWQELKVLTFKGQLKTYYFYNYWRHFRMLTPSSRGVSLEPINMKKVIKVHPENPQEFTSGCGEGEAICIYWKHKYGFIYLTESILIEKQSFNGLKRKLMYQSRFVEKGDGEINRITGWLSHSEFKERIDQESCIRERCIHRKLIQTHPEEMKSLFIELGIIERAYPEDRKTNIGFAITSGFKKRRDRMPFNRWIEKMKVAKQNESSKKEKKAEEEELLFKLPNEHKLFFSVRPKLEYSLGISYLDFSQSGDSGSFGIQQYNLDIMGSLVFPVYLDLELQLKAEASIPVAATEKQGVDTVIPVTMINDVVFAIPVRNDQAVVYMGPGLSLHNLIASQQGAGHETLFGGHLTMSYYSATYFGHIYLGFIGRDFNTVGSDFFWSFSVGRHSAKSRETLERSGFFIELSGYDYKNTEEDLLVTNQSTTDTYDIFQSSLNYLWEF